MLTTLAVLALVSLPGGAISQQRGAVDHGGHLRQLGLRELKVGQHLDIPTTALASQR